MDITAVRNATVLLTYGGKRILVDPVLGEVGSFESYGDLPGNTARNPIVPMALTLEEVLAADAVIVTHLHGDHFDDAARELLPKDVPMFAQDPADAKELENAGFGHVSVMESAYAEDATPLDLDAAKPALGDIRIAQVPGKHGDNDYLAELAGRVSGVMVKSPDEKLVYIAGDTVWYDGVEQNLKDFQPPCDHRERGRQPRHQGSPHHERYRRVVRAPNESFRLYRSRAHGGHQSLHRHARNPSPLRRSARILGFHRHPAEWRDGAHRLGCAVAQIA